MLARAIGDRCCVIVVVRSASCPVRPRTTNFEHGGVRCVPRGPFAPWQIVVRAANFFPPTVLMHAVRHLAETHVWCSVRNTAWRRNGLGARTRRLPHACRTTASSACVRACVGHCTGAARTSAYGRPACLDSIFAQTTIIPLILLIR